MTFWLESGTGCKLGKVLDPLELQEIDLTWTVDTSIDNLAILNERQMPQATHFVDLMRYLVGDIDKDSIQALAVGPQQMKLNDMAEAPLAEHPVSQQSITLTAMCRLLTSKHTMLSSWPTLWSSRNFMDDLVQHGFYSAHL